MTTAKFSYVVPKFLRNKIISYIRVLTVINSHVKVFSTCCEILLLYYYVSVLLGQM